MHLDKESFQDKLHPRFFGQLPRMPWKRRFYCDLCDLEMGIAETMVYNGGIRVHTIEDDDPVMHHEVVEVDDE